MNQPFIQWWMQSVQSALSGQQPQKPEQTWVAPFFNNLDGFNRLFSQAFGIWPIQPVLPHTGINWKFVEDAFSHYQQFVLQWMSIAMPNTTEKLESRLDVLEKQAMDQNQEIELLRRQASHKDDKIPESVTALQELIEKQGREFHRLTEGFKDFTIEHTKPSKTKK